MAQSRRTGATDLESPVTLYERIYEYLLGAIREGLCSPGTQIESEVALMKRFGVSRVTVRNAISRLVDEGLVFRRQGKGTFVVLPRLEYRLPELYGTAEVVSNRGIQPRMKILSHGIVAPEETVREALRLGGSEKVLRIERQDLAGDFPVAFAIIHLPEWLGRRVDPQDLTFEPLYRLLLRKYDIRVDRAHQTMRATKAGSKVALLLSIPVGDPVILAERTTFSSDGQPVESATVYYRAEILHFSVTLNRTQEGNLESKVSLQTQLSPDVLELSTILGR